MAESPSALLERAAARLEELAAGVEPGPWRQHDFAGEPILLSKPSADDKTTWRTVIGDGVQPAVIAWVEALQPEDASVLVAWMREAADAFKSYEGMPAKLMQSDDVVSAYGHTYRFMHGALEYARRILGEHSEETDRA